MENNMKMLRDFQKNGIKVLENCSQNVLENMVLLSNKQYHCYQDGDNPPFLTDSQYDVLNDFITEKFPNSQSLGIVGCEILDSKQKEVLPVNMPSMDKIKPDTKSLDLWKGRFSSPYVISDKLDGVSGLYSTINNKQSLYTRGNGTVGQNISSLWECISDIPMIPNVIIRGEFIISKNIFNQFYKDKYSNIRNMVAGLINSKKKLSIMKDIQFIAYEVIEPVMKPSDQMLYLENCGFNTVRNETVDYLSNPLLCDYLIKHRETSKYEIDGIIVSSDNIFKRTERNPEHSFAFKMVISDQIAETEVVDVIWTASKDGYLKPRIRLNPVTIGGSKIEYATGFNAGFIELNKIGIGAIVSVVRSGDVIPYVNRIIKQADTPKMPTVPYTWTNSHVDIVVTDKDNDPTVLEKQITSFFTTIEVDGLSSGNVKRIIDCGYDTIPKIIRMTEEDFMKVEGFQEKLSKKICNGIQLKIQNADFSTLITASGCLGRGIGVKKIKQILGEFPVILTSSESEKEKIRMCQRINGIGKENAQIFVQNIPKCIHFLKSCNLQNRMEKQEKNFFPKEENDLKKTHPLFEKKLIFTGFRDKPFMEYLERTYGVSFSSSVSKNIFIVVTKSLEDKNTKISQAGTIGIPVMSYEEFRKTYH